MIDAKSVVFERALWLRVDNDGSKWYSFTFLRCAKKEQNKTKQINTSIFKANIYILRTSQPIIKSKASDFELQVRLFKMRISCQTIHVISMVCIYMCYRLGHHKYLFDYTGRNERCMASHTPARSEIHLKSVASFDNIWRKSYTKLCIEFSSRSAWSRHKFTLYMAIFILLVIAL